MRVIEAGHVYEIHNVDDFRDKQSFQRIQFVRRRGDDARMLAPHPGGNGRREGILAQELLRVLIDRTNYLNAEAPCIENVAIVEKLRECLCLFEARAARRTIAKLSMPEMRDVCARCHHILCLCDEHSRIEHGIER